MIDLTASAHLVSAATSLFDYLDPLMYTDEASYRTMWLTVFNMMFQGTMARIGACVCLFYSFWYGTYKQKFGLGVMFFIFTSCFAYLGSVARILGIGGP